MLLGVPQSFQGGSPCTQGSFFPSMAGTFTWLYIMKPKPFLEILCRWRRGVCGRETLWSCLFICDSRYFTTSSFLWVLVCLCLFFFSFHDIFSSCLFPLWLKVFLSFSLLCFFQNETTLRLSVVAFNLEVLWLQAPWGQVSTSVCSLKCTWHLA